MTDEPALAPEPVEATEEKYEVIGTSKVFGVEPGQKFKRTLTPSEERLLGTHIKKVGAKSAKTKSPASPSGPTKKKKKKE